MLASRSDVQPWENGIPTVQLIGTGPKYVVVPDVIQMVILGEIEIKPHSRELANLIGWTIPRETLLIVAQWGQSTLTQTATNRGKGRTDGWINCRGLSL